MAFTVRVLCSVRRLVLPATLALAASLFAVTPADATYEPGEPEVTWGRQLSTSYDEFYAGVAVAGDTVWALGGQRGDDYRGSVIVRHDRDGSFLGQTTFSEQTSDLSSASALVAGDWGVIVVGGSGTRTFVARYEPDGRQVWITFVPEDAYVFSRVAVHNDTVVAGGTQGNGLFGSWRIDTFDLTTGATQLSRSIPGPGALHSIAVTDDQIVLGGLGLGYTEMVPGEHVGGDYDAVLIALDPDDLSTRWAHQFGTMGNDWVASLAVRDEVIYWSGNLGNKEDNPYDLMKGGLGAWDTNGNELWRRQLGPGYAPVRAMVATSEGLVLGGEVSPGQLGAEVAGHGGQDAYLQGRSFTGDTLWTEVYGASGSDGFAGLATEGDDRVYAAGYTEGRLFGDSDGAWDDAVLVALDVPHLQRPDLSVRTGGPAFRGDNSYGGRTRPVRVVLHRGSHRDVVVRIEDDGLVGDRQLLRSCGRRSGGLRLALRAGRLDVTRSTSTGTFRTRMLRPGSAQKLTLRIAAADAPLGTHTCDLVARSTSRRYEADRLRLTIVVRR